MTLRPRIALLIETSNAYARGILRGIRAYVRQEGTWSLTLDEQRRGEPAPAWLRRWSGQGVIARIETPDIARAILRSRLPAIDVSAARHVPELPYVETDDEAIARLAIGHLLERGFRHLAFCGDARFKWSKLREQRFETLARAAGIECQVYDPPHRRKRAPTWDEERRGLAQWLGSLPRPIGIMAAYDIRGRQILDVCAELGMAVPDEAAVIGVDNDELLCDLASPSLTSIAPDTQRTGFEAARLLDRLLHGEAVPAGAHLIQPLGVVTRGSTDVVAVADKQVSAAVRFIREHAYEDIKVADVVRHARLSRRVLETRFERLVGRSPHAELVRVRIERVKQLLLETDLPLAAVARRAGYRHIEYMTVAFKRETGLAPRDYRAQHG